MNRWNRPATESRRLSVAAELRRKRLRCNRTITEVAAAAGLDAAEFAALEAGERPIDLRLYHRIRDAVADLGWNPAADRDPMRPPF